MMTTYIGYDLGDGDTCISVYELQGNEMVIRQLEMPDMNAGEAMPTLLATDTEGRTLIGIGAVGRRIASKTSELEVNFKMRPTELDEAALAKFQSKVKSFTETLFRECRGVQDVFQDPMTRRFVVTVGHPTTWLPEDASLYKSIFVEAECFKNPCAFFGRDDITVELSVEAESDAALMNLINAKVSAANGNEKSYDITVDDIPPGSYAVVFDFGSSTTDITIMVNNDGHIETGSGVKGDGHLGARHIDRGIYDVVLARLSDEERQKYDKVLKGSRNSNLERRVIYYCRLAKEKFFNASESKRRNGDLYVSDPTTEFPLADKFCGDACGIMDRAVSTPITVLGGKSWKDACRDMFEQVKCNLEAKGSSPALVFLTGGASRMDFVREFAREAFSGIRIVLDSHPAHCISHGLAYLPHKFEKAKAFISAVKRYIADELPKMIEEQASFVAAGIADKMADRICSIAFEEAMRWKNLGYNTLNGMEQGIGDSVECFLKSSSAKQISGETVASVLNDKLVPLVKDELKKICKDFGVKYSEYGISDPLTDWAKEFEGIALGRLTGAGAAEGIGHEAVEKILSTIGVAVAAILAPIVLMIVNAIVIPLTMWLGGVVFAALIGSGVGIPVALAIVGASLLYVTIHGWNAMRQRFDANVKSFNLPRFVRIGISDDSLRDRVDAQRSSAKYRIMSSLSEAPSFKKGIRDSLVDPISNRFLMMAKDLALKIRK